MKTKISLVIFLALTVICLPSFAFAGTPEAVAYLKSQIPDAWIAQALIASGEINVPTDYLASVTEGSYPTADYAKAILALAAAGKNPTTYGSIDYVAKLKSYFNNDQMGETALLNDDIWSILALASIKKADSIESVASKIFLLSHQNADGGWGYDLTGGSDTNDTAAAIMALLETGISASDSAIVDALNYLQSLQNADGGFPYNPLWGSDSDSGSDAWVICALNKLGQDPTAWQKDGNNPVTNLRSLQAEDGGFWWVKEGASDWNNKGMTAYAVVALAGKSFPVGVYEIPQPIRLSASKSSFSFDESVIVTVEYFNGESWLALVGATVNGLDQNYLTNDSGQVSAVLPAGDYNVSAVKAGFITGEPAKLSVLAAPLEIPAPVSGGGSISIIPAYCQGVEYDVWQDACVDNWQYRNVLTTVPVNCALTVEQENQRKKTCVIPEAEDDSLLMTELEPEVLGVKISSSSTDRLNEITAEANEIINGQTQKFTAEGTNSTAKLGAGERAGVLNSYKLSFGKSPQTQSDWEDIIRISNNQLPLATSPTAEARAKKEFKRVYRKEASMENFNDQAAVNMIAYGLRPERRDLNSERFGIRIFTEVYKSLPVSTLDWDIVRAIAYSGINI